MLAETARAKQMKFVAEKETKYDEVFKQGLKLEPASEFTKQFKDFFCFPETSKPVVYSQTTDDGYDTNQKVNAEIAFLAESGDGGYVLSEYRLRTMSQTNKMLDVTNYKQAVMKDVDL
jgi:hypothetical protein